jgi:hypothetical protein
LSSSPLLEHFDPWERAEVLALLHLQGEGPYPVPEELSLPRLDPRSELERLYEAWALDAAVLTAEYERRIYPEGQILSLETDARLLRQDPRTREAWLTLLTLGSSHRIGRTHPEQHRGFVRQCRSRGWMQTFSDPEIKDDRWIRVLEEYWTEYQDGDQSYRPWMLQFISIYQFARWLPEYVEMLMTIERIARPFTLDEVTRPRSSAVFGGGGISAPGLDLSLGGGVCFVLRELVRGKVLRSTHVHRFCYFPSKAVRDYLNRMGCRLEDNAHSENSPAIHDFLSKYLGEEKATFNLGFDLALAWAAEQQGVPESPWWSGEP